MIYLLVDGSVSFFSFEGPQCRIAVPPIETMKSPIVIDCHGHYTTAPKALENWRNRQIAGIHDPASMPKVSELKISDDELRESIETNQLNDASLVPAREVLFGSKSSKS